jgi:protein-tyrosine phosphatase
MDPETLAAEDYAARHYAEMVREGAAALREAVEALAAPGALPAVFHCAAGKDRTGVLAAVVLRLLGVPSAVVADDYALSERATALWEASVRAGVPDDTATAWGYVPPSMLVAERRTMLRFLAGIDAEYGSVDGLAARLGIGERSVARLRASLLD